MAIETRPFDAAEYLDTPEAIIAYLEDALADADPGEFIEALGVVARAKGMASIARDIGVARPALYRSLSEDGRPEFGTVMKVLHTLGLSFHVSVAANSTMPAPNPGAYHALAEA